MPPEADPQGTETEPTATDPEGGKGGETPDLSAEVEKWKALARKNEQQAKANADAAKKLAELEEQDKSELQKLADAKATAERDAAAATAKALRLEVAIEKAPEGMPLSKVRTLAKRLQGDTRDELEADADELFADFAPDDGKKPPGRKPEENLRGGRNPETEPDIDPDKLAEEIVASKYI